MSAEQPNEEELRAAIEEQMRNIRVEDVLLQTIVTLINLGARRLGLTGEEGTPVDRGQAQLAIEGARALMPLLPSEELAPIRDALSQLQMAFAQGAAGGGSRVAGPEPETPAQQPQPADDEAEREKARSKIWTPPGS